MTYLHGDCGQVGILNPFAIADQGRNSALIGAAGVEASTASNQEEGPGASPRAALQEIVVRPVSLRVAKEMVERNHYLHSIPGGTRLSFGVFLAASLQGVVVLGVGPTESHSLIEGANLGEVVTLTRLWLADMMAANSESRVLGVVLRALRRYTSLKAVLSYADPSQGHVGTIYQASNWLYTGNSAPSHKYDMGDGRLRHSRSLGYSLGTHSIRHFRRNGVPVRTVRQAPKHRYIYLLDRSCRLRVPTLPYPKAMNGGKDQLQRTDSR